MPGSMPRISLAAGTAAAGAGSTNGRNGGLDTSEGNVSGMGRQSRLAERRRHEVAERVHVRVDGRQEVVPLGFVHSAPADDLAQRLGVEALFFRGLVDVAAIAGELARVGFKGFDFRDKAAELALFVLRAIGVVADFRVTFDVFTSRHRCIPPVPGEAPRRRNSALVEFLWITA